MSIKVALDDLAAELDGRGPAYLLTATEGGRPHVMELRFALDGGELRAGVGRSAARNIAVQPAVTLLWPPRDDPDRPELDGYSLIVDATATVEGDNDNPVAVVTAVGAVYHRPAPAL